MRTSGTFTRWRRDGKELVNISTDRQLGRDSSRDRAGLASWHAGEARNSPPVCRRPVLLAWRRTSDNAPPALELRSESQLQRELHQPWVGRMRDLPERRVSHTREVGIRVGDEEEIEIRVIEGVE